MDKQKLALVYGRHPEFFLFRVVRETERRYYGEAVTERPFRTRTPFVNKGAVVKYPATEADLHDAEAALREREAEKQAVYQKYWDRIEEIRTRSVEYG